MFCISRAGIINNKEYIFSLNVKFTNIWAEKNSEIIKILIDEINHIHYNNEIEIIKLLKLKSLLETLKLITKNNDYKINMIKIDNVLYPNNTLMVGTEENIEKIILQVKIEMANALGYIIGTVTCNTVYWSILLSLIFSITSFIISIISIIKNKN
jgi:hypothetical protein